MLAWRNTRNIGYMVNEKFQSKLEGQEPMYCDNLYQLESDSSESEDSSSEEEVEEVKIDVPQQISQASRRIFKKPK